MKRPTATPWRWVGNELVGGSKDDAKDPDAHGHLEGDEWVIDGQTIIKTDSGVYPPREADKALIAAAPDLLAACQLAEHYMGFALDYLTGKDAIKAEKAIDSVREAIAKAGGSK